MGICDARHAGLWEAKSLMYSVRCVRWDAGLDMPGRLGRTGHISNMDSMLDFPSVTAYVLDFQLVTSLC